MLTTDRAVTDLATYAPEQIGRTRYRTPEGFLVCEGVRIARTGPMLYSAKEMPSIELGPFGSMITVMRDAEVLFAPECIASYAGKPVTNDHPPVPVTPENFKLYAVGVVLDPRRGEGAESEYLLADLLITDKEAIEAIAPPEEGDKPKVEISAGYDSDVEQIKPGLARQTKNVGNHVALVDRARGGPALRIQDQHEEEPPMATRSTRRLLDGIRKAFKNRDEAALEEELGKAEDVMDDEGEGGEPQTLVIKVEGAAPAAAEGEAKDGEGEGEADPYEGRFKALEDTVGKMCDAFEGLKAALGGTNDGESEGEKKEGEGEEVTDEEAAEEEKEADKAQTQDAMSKAEILAPGVKLPTLDSAAGAIKRSAVTDLRRRSLRTALADSARKVHVEAVLGGRTVDIDKLPPSQVSILFDAAAAVAKAANNAGAGGRAFDIPPGRMTAAKLQARINERRNRA